MSTTAATEVRAQPSYRAFGVTVSRVRRLSPSFVRLTFAGPDLADFGRTGLDQRIKVVLPTPAGRPADIADFSSDSWYQDWRALPDDQRNPFRTYTVRAVRTTATGDVEVDVDFVLHTDADGHSGPASRWVAQVAPGDTAVISGPNALYDGPPVGLEWTPPATARTLLLAGDETAAPAITSIVESLPAGTAAHAFLEVPEEGDALDVRVPDGVHLTWLPRREADGTEHERGVLLDAAVRACMEARRQEQVATDRAAAEILAGLEPEDVDIDSTILWDVPSGHDAPTTGSAVPGCYAWIAGEAAVVRELRRHLVRDLGIDRRSVAFMGYWRRGRAEC
ncbi:siderophore-interacting protein [Sanguibacter suaedae]|uniref:Siderophore-interacting protein n=1 Tax=Sanguibacter suaedae TaxID=2795737 RepID=A0A934MEN9_9MICO|nr:siderophore-interacting protein [Sanguibacter suaedae]MBI9115874.1 siderophore-interacting protein [Sanguibacter suaedae]